MTQKELISKIKEWVLRRKYIHHNMYMSSKDDEDLSLRARTSELEDEEFIYFIDTLPIEKEETSMKARYIDKGEIIDKQSLIWHSLNEKPKFPKSMDEPVCSILVLYDNVNMFLYRYTKDGIPNNNIDPHFCDIINAKWCYCNDLIP